MTTIAVDTRPLGDVVAEIAELRAVAELLGHIRAAMLYAVREHVPLGRLGLTFLDERIVDPAIRPISISSTVDLTRDRLVVEVSPPRWRTPAVIEISQAELVRA